MKHPVYPVISSDDSLRFEFDSVSDTQTIRKVVLYARYADTVIFNLAMGDLLNEGTLDGQVRSNNADMDTVMATVVHTLLLFFKQYPGSLVYFEGSTASRTRLYQIIISRELDEASRLFLIQGIRNHEPEPFRIGQSYQAFLLSQR